MNKLRYHEAHHARIQRISPAFFVVLPAIFPDMTGPQVDVLPNMVTLVRDDALMRYSLGNVFLKPPAKKSIGPT